MMDGCSTSLPVGDCRVFQCSDWQSAPQRLQVQYRLLRSYFTPSERRLSFLTHVDQLLCACLSFDPECRATSCLCLEGDK